MKGGRDGPDGSRNDDEERLTGAVERIRRRREEWARIGEMPLGRALGMMGRFGWTIAIPIVAGAMAGRWLDRQFNSGVFWSAALVFAGAAAGFYMVWRKMTSES
jgi:ATP synthase protein I